MKALLKKAWSAVKNVAWRIHIELTWILSRRVLDAINAGLPDDHIEAIVEEEARRDVEWLNKLRKRAE